MGTLPTPRAQRNHITHNCKIITNTTTDSTISIQSHTTSLSAMDSPKSSEKSAQNESTEPQSDNGGKSEGGIKRPQLLRLKSENGLEKSVSKILPIDQTPTPTRLLNRPEWGAIIGATEKSDDTEKNVDAGSSAVPQVNVNSLPGPVTKTVTSVTVPAVASSVTTGNSSQTSTENQSGDAAMGGNDTTIEEIDTFGHEETVVTEETVTEEDSNDKNNFREPTTPQNEESQQGQNTPSTGTQPVMMTTAGGQQVVFASANNSFGTTGNNNQMPVMVVNGNQMMQVGGNVTSPMRVVTAGSGSNDGGTVTVMNTQSPGSNSQTNQGIVINGQGQKVVQLVMAQPGTPTTPTRVVAQPQQIMIPTSGGTQMIVNGTIANGGVQPFVMQQVMQIQVPQTGAIQTVITQPPQPQQFTMVQAVDPNSNTPSTSSANNNAPPTYTQCVMMPQQIQFVPQFQGQQFQMVPTNQHMIVNSQGQPLGQVQQQVQIINHGPVNGQNSSNQNGQNAMIAQIQQITPDKSRSRTSSQLSDTDGIDQSASNKTVALYNENKGSYSSRPSYTHRPQLAGLSSVVQLSKEALQAIEQAGNDCGSGKRGGPRLNYDDLDPKRRKFLERNRQAAARCRERKKQWIVSLEGRSNELKDDNRRVEEEIIRLKTKVDQLREVLTQQDRNRQTTHQRTQVVAQVQQEVQMETEMNTDSGVETDESLPTGEIIMAKTEMEAES